MLPRFFTAIEVAELFRPKVALDVTKLEAEARQRALPGQLEEIDLPGVLPGGGKIMVGKLVGIQPGLVLLVAGNGDSDGPMGNYFDLRFCSGIAGKRNRGGKFEIERFSLGWGAPLARMDVISSAPRYPHLDGMAGYMVCGVHRNEFDHPFIGFEKELWDRIVVLLNKYLPHPVP